MSGSRSSASPRSALKCRGNLGAMSPLGSLMGHLVYGLVLGIAYDAWPLG